MRSCRLHILSASLLLLIALRLVLIQSAHANTGGEIVYGASVSGQVDNRFGQEWTFVGRAGDSVTIQMVSTEFDTFLEVYGPDHRRYYTRNNDGENLGTNAQIADYTLPTTGDYVIVAVGRLPRDKGAYTLTLSSDSEPVDIPRTSSPALQGGATVTTTGASTVAAEDDVLCTVAVSYLNLRSGPGTQFDPPVTTLSRGTEVVLLARDVTGTWGEVRVIESGELGWLSTSPRYLACPEEMRNLPTAPAPG